MSKSSPLTTTPNPLGLPWRISPAVYGLGNLPVSAIEDCNGHLVANLGTQGDAVRDYIIQAANNYPGMTLSRDTNMGEAAKLTIQRDVLLTALKHYVATDPATLKAVAGHPVSERLLIAIDALRRVEDPSWNGAEQAG